MEIKFRGPGTVERERLTGQQPKSRDEQLKIGALARRVNDVEDTVQVYNMCVAPTFSNKAAVTEQHANNSAATGKAVSCRGESSLAL